MEPTEEKKEIDIGHFLHSTAVGIGEGEDRTEYTVFVEPWREQDGTDIAFGYSKEGEDEVDLFQIQPVDNLARADLPLANRELIVALIKAGDVLREYTDKKHKAGGDTLKMVDLQVRFEWDKERYTMTYMPNHPNAPFNPYENYLKKIERRKNI